MAPISALNPLMLRRFRRIQTSPDIAMWTLQEKEERAKKLVQENTKATSKMTKAERSMKEKEKKEKVGPAWIGCCWASARTDR